MTVPDFMAAKAQGRRLTMLTVYDYSMAKLLDAGGVDSVAGGRFGGHGFQGHTTSLPVTLDDHLPHALCRARSPTA